MSKNSRRDQKDEPGYRARGHSRKSARGEGPWEFTVSGSLLALGSTERARRAAYRTATGELRFIPL